MYEQRNVREGRGRVLRRFIIEINNRPAAVIPQEKEVLQWNFTRLTTKRKQQKMHVMKKTDYTLGDYFGNGKGSVWFLYLECDGNRGGDKS